MAASGVLALFDPPRDDANATISTARQMGVKVMMVTGDALAIAVETAKKLGMGATSWTPAALATNKQQESESGVEIHREGRWFRPGVPRTQITS